MRGMRCPKMTSIGFLPLYMLTISRGSGSLRRYLLPPGAWGPADTDPGRKGGAVSARETSNGSARLTNVRVDRLQRVVQILPLLHARVDEALLLEVAVALHHCAQRLGQIEELVAAQPASEAATARRAGRKSAASSHVLRVLAQSVEATPIQRPHARDVRGAQRLAWKQPPRSHLGLGAMRFGRPSVGERRDARAGTRGARAASAGHARGGPWSGGSRLPGEKKRERERKRKREGKKKQRLSPVGIEPTTSTSSGWRSPN